MSDYTALIARGLVENGDSVRVFTSPGHEPTCDHGVEVHPLPGRFGPRSLLQVDQLFRTKPPDRILVQYVPHGFGYKAMNLAFAAWVALRAKQIAPVWVMFHEVSFPFTWRPLRYAVLGAATRVMARLVVGAAERVFVSIPAWTEILKRFHPAARVAEWLPVPCTLEAVPSAEAVNAARTQYAPRSTYLVGHFGTFGNLIAPLLARSLVELLTLVPNTRVVLIGRGSVEFATRFILDYPQTSGCVVATGELPALAVAAHLRACDVLLQPFPDGVSSRRTSAMAGLANGVPTVTNIGFLSEPVWSGGAVAAVASLNPADIAKLVAGLLADSAARAELGVRGLGLYRDMFALEHTIAKLREPQRTE